MFLRVLLLWLSLSVAGNAIACELCSLYNADAAMGRSGGGFSLNVSEQFVAWDTVQRNGERLPHSVLDSLYVDKSMTHVVPTWNFSPRFGVGLSIPLIYETYREMHLLPADPFVETTSGEQFGLGDVSLIGRATVLQASKGEAALFVNALAGVKFPTGNAFWIRREVNLVKALDLLYGPGHQHAIGGVHFTDLTLGSGSFDGVFGLVANSRWARLFCNGQFQYYLRTPGESGYEFGDEWMISGGPGVFVLLSESYTLSAQVVAVYDVMKQDRFLGRNNRNSGMNAVYLGPLINLTLGERFTANAGVDLPINIDS